MKQILIIFCLFFIVCTYAQSDKQITKVAQQTCDCLSKTDIEPFTQEKYQSLLVQCLISAPNFNDALKESKLDMSKGQDAARDLGMTIGLKMLELDCKPYIDYSMKLVKTQSNQNTEAEEGEEENYSEGTFEGIDKTGDFAYILVKDESGRIQKYLWLEYFGGAEDTDGIQAQNMKGKLVSILWEEKELYSPR